MGSAALSMNFRAMSSIPGVSILLLAACAQQPAPPAAQPAPTSATDSVPAAAAQPGLKAYVDPASGELGVPPAAAPAAAMAGAAAVRADEPAHPKVEGRDLGNGVIYYEMPPERMVDEVVCVQPDGALSSNCPKKP